MRKNSNEQPEEVFVSVDLAGRAVYYENGIGVNGVFGLTACAFDPLVALHRNEFLNLPIMLQDIGAISHHASKTELRSRARCVLGVFGTFQPNLNFLNKIARKLVQGSKSSPTQNQTVTNQIRSFLKLIDQATAGHEKRTPDLGTRLESKLSLLRNKIGLNGEKTCANTQTVTEPPKIETPAPKPTIDEPVAAVPPQSPNLETFVKKDFRKATFGTGFGAAIPENKAPAAEIKQTFPTESFKKAPRVFTTHVSQATTAAQPPFQKQASKPAGRNPRLEFSAPESFQKGPKKGKNSPEKKATIKFPSPEKKQEEPANFSLQKSVSAVTGQPTENPVLRSPPKVTFAEEPKRFYNSKIGSGVRKATEEPRPELTLNRINSACVTENLNAKFFSRMDPNETKNEPKSAGVKSMLEAKMFNEPSLSVGQEQPKMPEPPTRPQATSDLTNLTTPPAEVPLSVKPKLSFNPVKIEQIVSRTSINSTLESLTGRGIGEIIDQLSTQFSRLKDARTNLKSEIQEAIRTCHTDFTCELGNYGSCVTGLTTPFSDMDLCIKTKPAIRRTEANQFLAKLTSCLAKIPTIASVRHIDTASVPVIKIMAQLGTGEPAQIDLTLETAENPEGLSTAFRTTRFVCDCISMYPSFKPVVQFVKYALNLAGLHDSYKGGLNAYGLSLLYLAFLHTKRCQNSSNVGRLTRDFLRFATQEFDPVRQAICFNFGYE